MPAVPEPPGTPGNFDGFPGDNGVPGGGGGPPPTLGGGGGSPLQQVTVSRYLPYAKRKVHMEQAANAASNQLQLQSPYGGQQAMTGFNPFDPRGMHGGAAPQSSAGANPYGDNPFFSSKGFNLSQGMQSYIGQIPGQQQRSLDSLRSYLSQLGQGNVRQAQLGAQLYNPDDPMMASYARMNAEQGARDTSMNVLGKATADSNAQYEDWLHGLLSQYYGVQGQPKQKQSNGLGGIGGQILGAGLGYLGL